MVLILIPFVLIVADIALAEFAEDPPVYIRQWAVSSPSGAAFDFSGNTYVVDRSHKLVKKSDDHGVPITEWLSCGAENPSKCYFPYDIAFDSNGNVYVIDANGIAKFDQDGKFLKQFGFKSSFGSGITVHSAVDSFNNPFTYVYVTNTLNHSVQKFTPDGILLAQWGRFGMSAGQFMYPYGIDADSKGNVYVADTYNWRIQKFDSNGNFLTQWPSSWPSGIAVDSSDNVYVISWSRCSIEKFTSGGLLLTQWGGYGKEEGKFTSPFRIDVSPDEEIYVSDTGNNRIQVFRLASIDEDGDGISDTDDNCPKDFNPDQDDDDRDGIGNQCDECPYDADNDADGDGICGNVDNCPEDSNSDQADVDGDGIGDICDPCDNRPIAVSISPSRGVLWPPNHRMISVNIEISSLVVHNPTARIGINSVTIIERNKKGDNVYSENHFEPDFEITGVFSLNLRSERTGTSQGRTYLITVTAEDCSGSYNFTTGVIVPHDKGK
jgi:sugar lactone lactonase YvrE